MCVIKYNFGWVRLVPLTVGTEKYGVSCSIIFGYCRGQSCLNSSSTNGLDENIDDIDHPYEYEGINPLDCLAEENDAAEHQINEEYKSC